MKAIFIILGFIFTMSCSRVHQGEAGIITSISGKISDELQTTGFVLTILDSMQTIDLTQNIIRANNITARDADSIPLQELDVNLTFNTSSDKVIDFYKKTKSITKIKDENGDNNYVLGYKILEDMLVNEIQKSIAKFKSKDITGNRPAIEAEIKESLQKMVNDRYGEVFHIVNLNLNTIKLNPDIEKSLQLIQVTRNQQLEVQAQKDQVQMRKELLDAEMNVKISIAKKAGLSVKDYLDYEIKRDFNKALDKSNNIQVQVK
jgi:hypothetical protein